MGVAALRCRPERVVMKFPWKYDAQILLLLDQRRVTVAEHFFGLSILQEYPVFWRNRCFRVPSLAARRLAEPCSLILTSLLSWAPRLHPPSFIFRHQSCIATVVDRFFTPLLLHCPIEVFEEYRLREDAQC